MHFVLPHALRFIFPALKARTLLGGSPSVKPIQRYCVMPFTVPGSAQLGRRRRHAVVARCPAFPRTQFLGRYDWEAAARLSADGGSAYSSGYAPTRALALHPALDLARTRSLAEFNQIVMGLMQVCVELYIWWSHLWQADDRCGRVLCGSRRAEKHGRLPCSGARLSEHFNVPGDPPHRADCCARLLRWPC